MGRAALRNLVSILLLAVAVPACSWGGSTHGQKVNVAPLEDLRLRLDIESLGPAFSDWKAIALGGIHLESGDPMPGRVDYLTHGEMLTERLYATVSLHATPAAALEDYLGDCRFHDSEGTNEYRGEGFDRVCIGKMRESESSCVWIGPRGMGYYTSSVFFLKGRVVVHIYETSDEPKAAKDDLIREITERLRPYAR